MEYWNLACDIAAESIIDDLYLKAVHVPKRQVRREYYRKLKERGGVVTAERVYRFLCEEHPSVMQMELLKREFTVDDHREWENDQNQKKNSPQPQRQRWDDIRDRMPDRKWRHFRKKRRMMCALWREHRGGEPTAVRLPGISAQVFGIKGRNESRHGFL